MKQPTMTLPRKVKIFLPALVLTIAGILMNRTASAQDYRLALGVRLSNNVPTLSSSFTGKYFITEKNAIEGLVSFGNRFGIGGLLEFHKPFATEGLSWFFGAGGYVGFEDDDTYLGPTGVLGLDYKFPSVPVNLSIDWKPELDILPSINFVPEAFAVSIRFVIK
jgi:hypothetical protein